MSDCPVNVAVRVRHLPAHDGQPTVAVDIARRGCQVQLTLTTQEIELLVKDLITAKQWIDERGWR